MCVCVYVYVDDTYIHTHRHSPSLYSFCTLSPYPCICPSVLSLPLTNLFSLFQQQYEVVHAWWLNSTLLFIHYQLHFILFTKHQACCIPPKLMIHSFTLKPQSVATVHIISWNTEWTIWAFAIKCNAIMLGYFAPQKYTYPQIHCGLKHHSTLTRSSCPP